MKLNNFFFASILVLTIAVISSAQNSGYTFTEVRGLPNDFDPSYFEFSRGDSRYRITNKGKGSVRVANSKRRFFDLRLAAGDYLLDYIFHAEHQGDLLIIAQAGDFEAAAGLIARIDMRRMRLKWKNSLAGFNIGNGLIHEGYAYITSIGFVGKINLESGRFAWKHGNLYHGKTTAFNSFDVPELKANTVVFKETPNYLRKKVAQVIVDRATGKILKIDI